MEQKFMFVTNEWVRSQNEEKEKHFGLLSESDTGRFGWQSWALDLGESVAVSANLLRRKEEGEVGGQDNIPMRELTQSWRELYLYLRPAPAPVIVRIISYNSARS